MKLPSDIIKALNDGKTSLGQHPSFPPEEEDAFTIELITCFFEDLAEGIENENISVDKLKSQLSDALSECKKIETKHTYELEKLCANTVNTIFNIPDNTLKIEMNIVDNIDIKDERLFPEKTIDIINTQQFFCINDISSNGFQLRILFTIFCFCFFLVCVKIIFTGPIVLLHRC